MGRSLIIGGELRCLERRRGRREEGGEVGGRRGGERRETDRMETDGWKYKASYRGRETGRFRVSLSPILPSLSFDAVIDRYSMIVCMETVVRSKEKSRGKGRGGGDGRNGGMVKGIQTTPPFEDLK